MQVIEAGVTRLPSVKTSKSNSIFWKSISPVDKSVTLAVVDTTQVDDIPGENGQQIDGAAQQHGEHVETGGTEDEFRTPDESQPFHHLTHHVAPRAARGVR